MSLALWLETKSYLLQRVQLERMINFDETFTHVARSEAIPISLAFTSHMVIKLSQMDIKCAFLDGFLNESVHGVIP